MAQEWREVISRRQERSKLHRSFVDGAATDSYACDAAIGQLHYPGVLDSGVFDTEVDLTPVRVDTPQFDGWRVSKNDWYYALGKDLANHGNEDGWVGFGGRQGAHWFKYRLLQLGYLHWPTRAWQDIGGTPGYNRGNLSQTVGRIEFPVVGASISAGARDTWENIWQTPGGGRLDVSWNRDGYHLKEEITINQAGRAWIAANRPPSTPPTETWFGFVVELDWSDTPQIYRAGILKQATNDFADDGEDIVLRDAMDRLLAFMPVSEAYVEVAPGERETVALRKRFYSEGGRHYLLVGARVPEMAAMPAGDLVFDPTIDAQVGASADDGHTTSDGFFYNAGNESIYGQFNAAFERDAFYRFTGISGLSGVTIDVAYISLYGTVTQGTPESLIYAEDAAAPLQVGSRADYMGRATTAAATTWDGGLVLAAWNDSPSIVLVIQELADSYDPSAIQILHKDDKAGAVRGEQWVYNWDFGDGSSAPKLHIEYTGPGGGGDPGHGVVGTGAGGQLGGVQSSDHGPVGPGGILWP